MMVGEYNNSFSSPSSVHVPPWSSFADDPCNGSPAGFTDVSSYAALRRYLPSNDADFIDGGDLAEYGLLEDLDDDDLPLDAYACDQFRMYDFKVRRCVRAKSHDWTECPYAHPGEKARRRDPRKYSYSGTACPDFRKGSCRKGDSCELAHGVFECWLHPNRYRTQPCKDGINCRRRVCFFAHTPEQLRVVTESRSTSGSVADSYDGSPLRQALEAAAVYKSSLPLLISPPGTPTADSPRSVGGSGSMNELVASLRQLQLNKVKPMPQATSYNLPAVGLGSPGFGSPRGSPLFKQQTPAGFYSLPNTPTGIQTRTCAVRHLDMWESSMMDEEPAMERVESGRSLRAMMFEKLRSQNSLLLDRADSSTTASSDVDVGWVTELLR